MLACVCFCWHTCGNVHVFARACACLNVFSFVVHMYTSFVCLLHVLSIFMFAFY